MLILGAFTGESIIIDGHFKLIVESKFTDGSAGFICDDDSFLIHQGGSFSPYKGVRLTLLPIGYRGEVRMGFDAPRCISIDREKIHNKKMAGNKIK